MNQDIQIEKIMFIRELCKDLVVLYKEDDNYFCFYRDNEVIAKSLNRKIKAIDNYKKDIINYLKQKRISYAIIDNNFNVIDRSSYERF